MSVRLEGSQSLFTRPSGPCGGAGAYPEGRGEALRSSAGRAEVRGPGYP